MNKTFGRKLRQGIGILLTAAVVSNMLPLGGLAVSASENSGTGICEHHTEHTEDCGYAEAEDCRHEHTEECYTAEGESDCHHEHDEDCGYAKAHECTYVCEICSNKASREDDVKDSDAEDADLSRCEGEKTENSSEENKEDAGQEDAGEQDGSANLCAHHKEHTKDCGYSRASEDGEGSPCTYECKLCPIEDLIAALPRWVTEDNRAEVEAQVQEILDLWRELDEDEQEQIDLSPCWDLQAELDEANVPAPIDESTEGNVAMVKKEGAEPTYVTSLADAFATGNSGAKITLLADVDIGNTRLDVPSNTEFTLDCGKFILSGGADYTLVVYPGAALTFAGGTVRGTGYESTVLVNGTFTMSGGVLDSTSADALLVNGNYAQVAVTGGTVGVSGSGLYVNDNSKATIALSGGTYSSIYPGREGTYGNYTYRPVSSVLADGYALKGADGKFIRGDATKTQRDVTVVKCTHDGAATPNEDGATHGGNCPYCGTEFAEAPHTIGDGNVCEGCGTPLVASVKISSDITYYGNIGSAWTAVQGKTATVTLLANVTASDMMVAGGDDITFDGGEFTLTGPSNNNKIIDITGGKLTVTGGTLKTGENTSGHLSADIIISGGELVVTGGSLEAGTDCVGLFVMGNAPVVKLSGGTFHGIGMNTDTVGRLLLNYGSTNATDKHYAYYQGDEPVDLTKLEKQYVLTGTVTVGECEHKGVTPTSNNNGTHSLKCPYCGYIGAANCSYGTKYQHDDTYHWLTCTVCGYENKEAHLWAFMYEQTGNVTENYWLCFDCRRTKDHRTLTITVPTGLTYGNTEGKKVTYTLSPEKTCDKVRWRFTSGGWAEFADGVLPANLPVGEHWFRVDGLMSDDTIVFSGACYLTVSAAPLTGDMVTLAPASAVYSGASQKPTITVKQGEATLKEGTDYDVTYSTNNFTNAGTVIVIITGKGNYKGTVEKTYTIKKAVLTTDGTGIANGTYGAKLSELSVAGLKAVYLGTTTEVPGTWALTGSTVPGVGDAGTYTASFTPAAGAENFEPLTAQVKLNIAKAAAPVPYAGTLYAQNNRKQSYQYDLTQLLPALDNGKSFGTVNYTLGVDAVNISGGYYTDGATITGTTLTMPIQKVEDNNEGNIGTVSITISSRNYEDMTAVINVTSVNKTPVTITGVNVERREYNGEAASCTGTPGAVESGGDTATISSKDYRYTWKKADGTVLNEAPKNAGSYLLIVSVDNDTYIGSRTISFVIDKAKITITADSMTADKGGAEPALTYTISGLAKGDTLTTEPTLTCIADMNTAGRYPIIASGAEVPDTDNYHSEITYVPGTLTVTVRTPGGGSGSSGGGNSGGSGNASGGNSSGSENNGDSGQGSSGDNGGGNATPGASAIPSITDTNPKMDTEAAKPGTGNTVRPGTGTGAGSSAAQETMADTGIPFIKGEDGKIGWNVIRAEEEKAEEGSVINVDMNGATVVPGDIFDSIKGRDVTITFDMGSGILWSVDGKSIITDKADDIDFTVRREGSAVPVDIVNNVTGEYYSIQLSLAYDGEFGFTAVLSVNLGKENAGYTASLYYYNQNAGELEFMCADEMAEDGTVSFAFTHASDYVIVIDKISEELALESVGNITEAPAEEEGNSSEAVVSPKEIEKTQKSSAPWLILAGVAVVILGAAGILIWKRKKEEGN